MKNQPVIRGCKVEIRAKTEKLTKAGKDHRTSDKATDKGDKTMIEEPTYQAVGMKNIHLLNHLAAFTRSCYKYAYNVLFQLYMMPSTELLSARKNWGIG